MSKLKEKIELSAAEVTVAVTRTACTQAPAGKACWTIFLVNEKLVPLGYALNEETVRIILKK